MKELQIPTIKPALKKLILDALAMRYTSVSGKEQIATGNHYQSVTLGDEHTTGFRSIRDSFLDQINLRGKRVLDLGANLGEISRAARARGAAVVDGFEYDPFFVEMAQAVNAYNGTTGVSFYERDITDLASYVERYDIVLAFSVFTYIHAILERLAELTDEALVIETHKLDGNLERGYLAPVRKFFPVYKVLGESEWGGAFSPDEKRAVIVFARDEKALHSALAGPVEFQHRSIKIDVQRTALQRLFFEANSAAKGDELLAEVQAMEIDLAQVADDPDLAKSVYSGKIYWLLFLKGYSQYRQRQGVVDGNIYYDYITRYYAPRRHDPKLCDALRNPRYALERVTARFRDVDRFREAPRTYVPAPLTLFRSGEPKSDRLELFEAGTGQAVHASAVDGWHRLFSARVFGADTIPAQVVETTAT
jgi:SAM-dependent methyltransferase